MDRDKNKHHPLRHLDEFQTCLPGYRPSADSLRTLMATRLTLLVAPTSSGRNTVIRHLLKTGQYHYMVSDTTRPPRVNDGVMERDGVEYWFKSERAFLDAIRAGKYLEFEIIHNQQVSGTNISELEAAHAENQIAITDVDIAGIETLHRYKPNAVCIMLLPPGFEEWMRRLRHRGPMPPDELHRRLQTASAIIDTALSADYMHFVINDSLENCVEAVHRLSVGGESDPEAQDHARSLAEQLAVDVKLFLGS